MVAFPSGEALLNKNVAGYYVPCSLLLEDDISSYIAFESFPVDEGITEGYNADFTKTQEGRAAEPLRRTWQGGDWNPIQISLTFVAGLNPLEAGPTGRAVNKMVDKINWIKAACFPRTDEYSPAGVKESPTTDPVKKGRRRRSYRVENAALAGRVPFVLFVWGLFMTFRGKIHAWTVQWGGPFDPISGKPGSAIVNITYMPENGFYPNWYSIRSSGGNKVPSSIIGNFI